MKQGTGTDKAASCFFSEPDVVVTDFPGGLCCRYTCQNQRSRFWGLGCAFQVSAGSTGCPHYTVWDKHESIY